MTPEQLKSSILQAAIQGKLVNQDSNDSSLSTLLEAISKEKQQRIDNGNIKKEKPLPELTNENIPFDIPDTWQWMYCRDVMRFINGRAYKKTELLDKGKYPVLRVGNFYTNESWYYSDLELGSDKYCEKGDLLYSWSASFGPKIWDGDKVIFHYHIWKLDYFQPMNIKYLYYYLLADTIRIKNSSHGLGFVFVTKEFMEARPIPVPPLEEQHRIVAKIEELLPFVDRYAASYEKLEKFNAKFPEDMKKSILQYAIQGKLVEQRTEEGTAEELYQQIQDEKAKLIKEGKIKKEKPLGDITEDEIPFDIPENWMWVRWGDISQGIQYGYNASAQSQGRIKMVRISDIQNGKVLWDTVPYCNINEEEISTYLLKEKDILFARTGGTVGKSFLVEKVPEDAIYAGYLIRTRYSELLCPQYLKYFMGTQLYWNQLRNGTIATAQPNCNGQTLSKMILPLPPCEEQKRIVAKIEELLPYCDMLIK